MDLLPLYDDSAPVSCTIGSDEVSGRIELIERIRTSLDLVERTEHGLLLRFPSRPDIEADLRQFAVDEKRCCEFWGFQISTGDQLTLRWDGPPAAGELLDTLQSYLKGATPISVIAGML